MLLSEKRKQEQLAELTKIAQKNEVDIESLQRLLEAEKEKKLIKFPKIKENIRSEIERYYGEK